MDSQRHKTLKRHHYTGYPKNGVTHTEQLQTHLENGAKNAYSRQWHRIERGLRLNRLRIFIEDISDDYMLNKEEKDDIFLFFQKALDKKLLNTLKVVEYDAEKQRILSIKGLSMIRNEETGKLNYELNSKEDKSRTDTTRKRKKDIPSVSVPSNPIPSEPISSETLDSKIEEEEEKE
jgi:hypothetical protein